MCHVVEKPLALPLCTHSVAEFLLLAAWSLWVSPKHALCPHFTHLLPDDLSISAASECIQCALENSPCSQPGCQDAHSFRQPYVCLSPHCSLHMQGLRCWAICFSLWLCVHARECVYACVSPLYRGIQHQHSGEATANHRISSCWLSFPHCCGRHRHRL